ncbi:hypothetical protein [Nocardiopsis tropica]|uniref:Uncharacterized protein n=1 Tax=Nocardiopsis tropica TaxID=109330 RepID=A0ABU7KSJ4_9ACTN|nr:hypothetical protein [Nocardiopsis umidischolae]MEE2052266.1 hypothetical protein [Nocardiopsis umidischolae]
MEPTVKLCRESGEGPENPWKIAFAICVPVLIFLVLLQAAD